MSAHTPSASYASLSGPRKRLHALCAGSSSTASSSTLGHIQAMMHSCLPCPNVMIHVMNKLLNITRVLLVNS